MTNRAKRKIHYHKPGASTDISLCGHSVDNVSVHIAEANCTVCLRIYKAHSKKPQDYASKYQGRCPYYVGVRRCVLDAQPKHDFHQLWQP
jgi:hypothetical protein